jgi:multidrug resistance protein MdtO
MTMAAVAPGVAAGPRPWGWLREFLEQELAPYPGRVALVARMVLAVTVVMIVNMTFRIPYGAFGAIYALVISREDTLATLNAVKTNAIALALAAGDVLIGAMLFAGDPMLRLLWVVVTLFTLFFAVSAMTNYAAATRFGYLVVITISLWDRHTTAEAKVEGTLWAVGAITLASVITAGIELTFAGLKPWNDLAQSLADRLSAVEELLACYAEDRPVGKSAASQITRLAMVGASRLRRLLRRSGASMNYSERMGAVVALVGRLVDLAAGLVQINPPISQQDRGRIRFLAQNIADIRVELLGGRTPTLVRAADPLVPTSVPLLPELERTVSMIPQVFAGPGVLLGYVPHSPGQASPARLLVPDAFTNPEHIKFGLKGGLAASLCYLIYTSLAWPEISTALNSCLLTALTALGASRQKQILRFTGALTGGMIGILAQIFILPSLDTITGFTVLFLLVTGVAAWIASSGPRLSYFGVQFAAAFYIINLQEFKIQTSLTVARDRIVGNLLGLVMMWLVFDQLWGAPAGVEMKKAFISLLRSLAGMARNPFSRNRDLAVEQSYALRETVNNAFNKVRSHADAVVFEFGPSRQMDLALRGQIRGWQPQLRVLFISCVALLKYRLQLPGFELPEPMRSALEAYGDCLARTLDAMADRLQGKAHEGTQNLEAALVLLKKSVRISDSGEGQGTLTAQVRAFLSLSESITDLAVSLDKLQEEPRSAGHAGG